MSGYPYHNKISRTGALLAFALLLLLPVVAFAIPGSGEFVAHYTEGGREMTELYNLIAKICLGILILVEGVLLFAIIAFRRKSDDERPVQNHGNLRLEAGWTLGALAIQIWIGVVTIDVMFSTETPPDEIDMTIIAEASQWDWDFHYEFPDDDDREPFTHPDLVVPAHHNVNLIVKSDDVLHAIFVPDLGIKIDAVPGRNNRWWFRADGPVAQVRARDFATIDRLDVPYTQTRPPRFRESRNAAQRQVTGLERRVEYLGYTREVPEVSPYADYNAVEYQGTCAELCGRDHWDMYFRAVVMTPSSFDRWVDDRLTTYVEPEGDAIYARRCSTCHGDDGMGDAINPTLVGVDRVVDPDMIDDHIEIVLQGEGQMPQFGAVLNDEEVAAVINHERTSWGNDGGTIEPEEVARVREALGLEPRPAMAVEPTPTDELMATGERIYQSCIGCHGADGQSFDPDLVPPLANNDLVVGDEVDELTRILVEGRDSDQWPGRKSPVARSMTDEQLASLLTYLRGSFGNDAPPVQPIEINEIRTEME